MGVAVCNASGEHIHTHGCQPKDHLLVGRDIPRMGVHKYMACDVRHSQLPASAHPATQAQDRNLPVSVGSHIARRHVHQLHGATEAQTHRRDTHGRGVESRLYRLRTGGSSATGRRTLLQSAEPYAQQTVGVPTHRPPADVRTGRAGGVLRRTAADGYEPRREALLHVAARPGASEDYRQEEPGAADGVSEISGEPPTFS